MASVSAAQDDDDDAPVDGINITPLVDVLMVVLVMFILTATAQIAGIKVNLPGQLFDGPVAAQDQGDLRQRCRPGLPGRLSRHPARAGGQAAHREALNPDFPVIVRGDAAVQYQKVVEVLDLLRRLELAQVGLVTGKPQ